MSGVGVAIPIAALLVVNAAQTGHPFEFGYIAMWGKSHALGFHEAPWGFPHTPARGLELVNLYLLRLQTYFLETPVPSLLFATGALALTRRLTAFDRWALAGSGLLLLSYFAYWFDGFYLGPTLHAAARAVAGALDRALPGDAYRTAGGAPGSARRWSLAE